MRSYKYNKNKGALQEAALAPAPRMQSAQPMPGYAPPMQNQNAAFHDSEPVYDDYVSAHNSGLFNLSDLSRITGSAPTSAQSTTMPARRGRSRGGRSAEPSLDPRAGRGGQTGMFYYTIEEGQKVLAVDRDGRITIHTGPAKVWRRGKRFRTMEHHVAHPGEFLIVRFRDGRQEHQPGPTEVWLDPRVHLSVQKEESFQISDREAIVVYSQAEEGGGSVERRIVHGPEDFVPKAGEWLHTFSWHGSRRAADGSYQKVPNALVFQKLWLLPDQMYHDVPEVRTADGVVLTIRLMLFFELRDIERMLTTTHDPIGDFVNAATSDVVEFLSKTDFSTFKDNIEKLNDLAAYKQLTSRAEQCGYRINKVVYRGYGAPAALQQMHEQALESRTRLSLEKATEEQAQELEDIKLERRLARAEKERAENAATQAQRLEFEAARATSVRESHRADAELDLTLAAERERARLESLARLHELGVDLTAYLTQARADRVIELRGAKGEVPHVHVDS